MDSRDEDDEEARGSGRECGRESGRECGRDCGRESGRGRGSTVDVNGELAVKERPICSRDDEEKTEGEECACVKTDCTTGARFIGGCSKEDEEDIKDEAVRTPMGSRVDDDDDCENKGCALCVTIG